MSQVFVYAEYQVSVPFTEIDWLPINDEIKQYAGLGSKTWLSGVNTNSIGGFYEFDSLENAQNYIEGLLIPFTKKINGTLSVKIFDGIVTKEASSNIGSPYYFKAT